GEPERSLSATAERKQSSAETQGAAATGKGRGDSAVAVKNRLDSTDHMTRADKLIRQGNAVTFSSREEGEPTSL
ncbi:MAG TPA: hypothetical protein PLF68_14275, partial [Nitrospira sp.]|nr:hypothetical protein [Nitrospira sp.]